MRLTWPDSAVDVFGADIIHTKHTLHEDAAFSDEGLAAILDAYPREELGLWTFGGHTEGLGTAIRGMATGASGAEIMQAVRTGHFWLNLRKANLKVEQLGPIGEEVFTSLEQATGRGLRKKDMGLLISSPGIHVNYHLDIPLVCLLQIRGQKRLWLYPVDETHAPSDQIEDIVHSRREEDLTFRNAFDESASVIELKPGMGLTWPQAAPHRVLNADCVNVSLSCEYMTLPALVRANAIYTNGLLRSRLGMKPQMAKRVTPLTVGKAAAAQALKRVAGKRPDPSPTPIKFELDPSADQFMRPV